MTAPSNANTSGLEVVAWLTTGGDVTRSEAYAREQSVNDPDKYPSALVTAASAQAAIEALKEDCDEWRGWYRKACEEIASEKARADRLAKALERAADDLRDIGTQKPQPTNSPDPEHENYLRRVLISLGQVGNARARAALQQETQK